MLIEDATGGSQSCLIKTAIGEKKKEKVPREGVLLVEMSLWKREVFLKHKRKNTRNKKGIKERCNASGREKKCQKNPDVPNKLKKSQNRPFQHCCRPP